MSDIEIMLDRLVHGVGLAVPEIVTANRVNLARQGCDPGFIELVARCESHARILLAQVDQVASILARLDRAALEERRLKLIVDDMGTGLRAIEFDLDDLSAVADHGWDER